MKKIAHRYDKSSIARFYDSLAPVYTRLREFGHGRDTDAKRRLLNALSPFRGDTVLDIGTGPGIYALDIAKADPTCRVVGIDISETFVGIARDRASQAMLGNVEFEVGNIEKLDFEDSTFSKIICAGVISVVKKRDRAVKELARVLEPGGILAIREPRRSESAFSRFVAGLPTKSRIRRMCARSGLLFGHFSPDFLTQQELSALFDDIGFSDINFERCGGDMLITAAK